MNDDPEVTFNGPEYEAVDAAVAHFRNMCPLEAARFSDLEALRDRMHDVLVSDRSNHHRKGELGEWAQQTQQQSMRR